VTNRKAQKRKAHKPTAAAEDLALATKITEAVKAVDTAVATQIERAKAAGLLLLDAHKRHPGRTAFEAFLKLTDGVQYSRAMDLIGVATDRKTFEKLQADNAARQQKHRDKMKSLPKPEPKVPPKLEPIVRDVTDDDDREAASAERRKAEFAEDGRPLRTKESAEISIEQRRAENADLDLSAEEQAAKRSAYAIGRFTESCRTLLPLMTDADQRKALDIVIGLTGKKPKAKAA
jgi:hypothetical protein